MPVQLVNPDPQYANVHLIDPAPLGYLHLAANVEAAHRPGPVLRRSRDWRQMFGLRKWQARQLAELHAVERVTVHDAVVFAPSGGDPAVAVEVRDTRLAGTRRRPAWTTPP